VSPEIVSAKVGLVAKLRTEWALVALLLTGGWRVWMPSGQVRAAVLVVLAAVVFYQLVHSAAPVKKPRPTTKVPAPKKPAPAVPAAAPAARPAAKKAPAKRPAAKKPGTQVGAQRGSGGGS
jgi:hypothetical protein